MRFTPAWRHAALLLIPWFINRRYRSRFVVNGDGPSHQPCLESSDMAAAFHSLALRPPPESARAIPKPILLAVFNANYRVYGRRKMKAALRREHGINLDKDRIARLMAELGIRGATRTKSTVTTRSDRSSPRAPDLVNRQFKASRPNELWVCDFERHEAFLILAVVKGHRHRSVAADWLKLRAA